MTQKPRFSFYGWHFAILVLVVMMAMVIPASATVYTIGPGDSIQAAINGAASGDTIVLHDFTPALNMIIMKRFPATAQ